MVGVVVGVVVAVAVVVGVVVAVVVGVVVAVGVGVGVVVVVGVAVVVAVGVAVVVAVGVGVVVAVVRSATIPPAIAVERAEIVNGEVGPGEMLSLGPPKPHVDLHASIAIYVRTTKESGKPPAVCIEFHQRLFRFIMTTDAMALHWTDEITTIASMGRRR